MPHHGDQIHGLVGSVLPLCALYALYTVSGQEARQNTPSPSGHLGGQGTSRSVGVACRSPLGRLGSRLGGSRSQAYDITYIRKL